MITAHDVVEILNEALRLDPSAINALIRTRTECNAALDNYSNVQTWSGAGKAPLVGVLGLLNGIFAGDGETIIFHSRGDGQIVRFSLET